MLTLFHIITVVVFFLLSIFFSIILAKRFAHIGVYLLKCNSFVFVFFKLMLHTTRQNRIIMVSLRNLNMIFRSAG